MLLPLDFALNFSVDIHLIFANIVIIHRNYKEGKKSLAPLSWKKKKKGCKIHNSFLEIQWEEKVECKQGVELCKLKDNNVVR